MARYTLPSPADPAGRGGYDHWLHSRGLRRRMPYPWHLKQWKIKYKKVKFNFVADQWGRSGIPQEGLLTPQRRKGRLEGSLEKEVSPGIRQSRPQLRGTRPLYKWIFTPNRKKISESDNKKRIINKQESIPARCSTHYLAPNFVCGR